MHYERSHELLWSQQFLELVLMADQCTTLVRYGRALSE